MSRQFWQEPLSWLSSDGTAVANTVTETIVAPACPIPGNYMNNERLLSLKAFGKLSTTGTPTIIFRVRFGGVSGTVLALSETITNGSGVTNVNWSLDGTIMTRSNGSSGSLFFSGVLHVHTAAGTVVTNVLSVSGYDAPAAVTADLTADADLVVTAQWGTASASNTLTAMHYHVTSLN